METITQYRHKDHVWRIETRENNEILGGAFVIIKNNTAKLGYIKSNKEGVGRELLTNVIQLAKDAGCTELVGSFLPVLEAYSKAMNLYTSFGFVVDENKQTILLSL